MSFTTNDGTEGTEYDDRDVLTRQEEDVGNWLPWEEGGYSGGAKARLNAVGSLQGLCSHQLGLWLKNSWI